MQKLYDTMAKIEGSSWSSYSSTCPKHLSTEVEADESSKVMLPLRNSLGANQGASQRGNINNSHTTIHGPNHDQQAAIGRPVNLEANNPLKFRQMKLRRQTNYKEQGTYLCLPLGLGSHALQTPPVPLAMSRDTGVLKSARSRGLYEGKSRWILLLSGVCRFVDPSSEWLAS